MAVQIRVMKNGRPVSGVNVYYRKKSSGSTGEKTTDDQGYVTFQVDAGMAAIIRIRGKGISYEENDYYLKSGLNEFKFGISFNPILQLPPHQSERDMVWGF